MKNKEYLKRQKWQKLLPLNSNLINQMEWLSGWNNIICLLHSFFVFSLLISTLAFSQSANSPFKEMKLSYDYEAAGNYPLAIKTIINTEFPENLNYQKNMRLGWLNYLNYNSAAAISYYMVADGLEPRSLEAKEALLNNYFALGEFSKAERMAHNILKISKVNYQARMSLARLALMNLNYLEAEYQLKKTIQFYPSDYTANSLLKECYIYEKDKKKIAEVETSLNCFYPTKK